MRRAFIDCLGSLVEKDRRIYLLVLDVGYGVLESFQKKFPDRFINVGIAEQNAVSFATGMALKGKKPFVYSINSFLAFRAYEQIRECACMNANVALVGVGLEGEYYNYGISHNSTGDLQALNAIRGLNIFTPKTREEVSQLVKQIYDSSGTNYLRLSRFGSL